MTDETKWTAICTSCGHVDQQDECQSACPECGFAGLVRFRPGDSLPPEVRRELGDR